MSRNLMSVRAELVRDQLVGAIHAQVDSRYPGDPPDAVAAELGRALERLTALEDAVAAPPQTVALAGELARMGYLARATETEMFEPARAAGEWLTGELARIEPDPEDPPWAAVAELCAELAADEPPGRPDPGPQAAPSWRIPGPGGHVRHYTAIGAAADRGPKDPDGNPRLPDGIAEPAQLKRCWLYGFLLRCCEEEISRSAPERSPEPLRKPPQPRMPTRSRNVT